MHIVDDTLRTCVRSSAAGCRARFKRAAAKSRPMTSDPRSARASACLPWPQPISIMRHVGESWSNVHRPAASSRTRS